MAKYTIEKIVAKTGQEVYRVNNYYLHSKYDPISEAGRLVEKEYKINCIHILFGYGNGYILDALLDKVKNESIIIIDPLLDDGTLQVFARHMQLKNVYYWSEHHNNTLGFVISKLANGLNLKIHVFASSNYNQIFKQEYKEILLYIRDFQNRMQVNYNTEVQFSNEWQQNFTKNVLQIAKDNTLLSLENKFDLPVVLAASGPSLTKQLPLLKEVEQNVLIIAAGSTINALLDANIEPDFVISIDGGKWNYEHFKNLSLQNARLIYAPYNHPGVRKSFKKQAFIFSQIGHESMGGYLYEHMGINLPIIAGGGTVAHYGVTVAGLLNSGPIAMIGQDLAYTNNQTHAQGNKFINTVQDLKELGKDLFEVDGYNGEPVQTSREFLSMKMVFEEIAQFHKPSVPLFNCTEGGVSLRGYEQLPFKSFIEQYVDTKTYKDLSTIETIKPFKTSDGIIAIYKNEVKIINDLQRSINKGLEKLNKIQHNIYFDEKTLIVLDEIEKKIEEKTKMIQIHFLIAPITYEVANQFLPKEFETQEETYKRSWNQTNTLYKRLLEALEKSKKNLQGVIDTVENNNQELL
ncbi:motility associated factor glycosyltransferase family protein [Lysinibacillus agricola]|uniref:Motility associated factor glycosyltransferase family protein n=1 Tax=Lysinibacillus agricola TaxID=2590012 RepID=A0ABX7ATE7_9BACI|nr:MULTISPECIES: 6-hydroxymethylpterin diphosphokinase MptE-like protein [Lysinibacillus]KOS60736.1 hypothetical protein AN161_21580 [Lysinibacillus sp. FJAT-14222]QQP13246.1 motility associated factor glycosyltransferase family protein [Lysinibacillus agricola]